MVLAPLNQLQCSGSSLCPGSSGGLVGTRKDSLAQAPRSFCLQRSEQKGRKRLAGAYRLGPPQVGQVTVLGVKPGAEEADRVMTAEMSAARTARVTPWWATAAGAVGL